MTPFEWAKAELKKGVVEIPGKLNNLRILFYHSFTTLKANDDETPWCSSFMCAAHASCGYPYTKSAAAKSWLDIGDEGNGAIGDIAVFKRAGGNHVAFIARKYTKGERVVVCLGGNQSNAVRVSEYLASNLIGIRRVSKP